MATSETDAGNRGASFRSRSSEDFGLRRVYGFVADGVTLRLSVFVVAVAVAAFAFSESSVFEVFVSNPYAVPYVGAAAAASLVPAFLVAVYVLVSDPGERVPTTVLSIGFFFGAVVAVFAGSLNGAALERFQAIPVYAFPFFFFLFVGPVEEGLKVLAAHLHPGDTRVETVMGYAVLGAFVGLGFAFAENVFYVASNGTLGWEGLAGAALGRASVGPLHVVLTAIAGYYVGKARLSDRHGLLTAAGGLVTVAVLHGTTTRWCRRCSRRARSTDRPPPPSL